MTQQPPDREAIARMIDPTAFSCTPEMYGMKTEKELERHHFVGGAREVARAKADAILSSFPVGGAIWNEVGETARRYANCYKEGSDGRNTFIMFAEWAEKHIQTRPSESGEKK